ncbi:MAG: protein kinase [Myxococcota bacterium]
MPAERQFAVLGPLQSGVATRAFLGVEVVDEAPLPDRPVVIVWLPDELTGDARRLARLQLETELVRQLRHPNIIDVHGLVAFEEGWARIVQFVDGEPLSRIIKEAKAQARSFEPTLVARLILDVCRGVAYAHEEGMRRLHGNPIVHGGLRPDTIMIGFDGVVSVTGYGASALAPKLDGRPTPGSMRYFAPEQVLGGQATASPTTDVYMIGAVLYELLGAELGFDGEEDPERAILDAEPPKRELKGVAAGLQSVALRAMAKRSAERFETIDEVAQAVRDVIAHEDLDLPPVTDISAFVEALIPADAPERVGRKDLLATAADADSVTMLTTLHTHRRGETSGADTRAVDNSQAAEDLKTAGESQESEPAKDDSKIADVEPAKDDPQAIDESPTTSSSPLSDDEDALPPFKTSPLSEELASLRQAPRREADTVLDEVPPRRPDRPAATTLGRAVIEPPIDDDERITQGRIPIDDLLSSGVRNPPSDQAVTDRVPAPVESPPEAGPANVLPPPQYYPVYPPPGTHPVPSSPYPAAYPHPYAPPGYGPSVAYPGYGHLYPSGMVMVPGRPSPQPPKVQTAANPGAATPRDAEPEQVTDPRLLNAPVKGLNPPAVAKRSSPIRDGSVSITHFNRRAGDGSRSFFVWALAAVFGLLAFVFLFPKEPPEGLDQPSARTRLPPELVREALSRRSAGAVVEASAPVLSSTVGAIASATSVPPVPAAPPMPAIDTSVPALPSVPAADTRFEPIESDPLQPAIVEPPSLRRPPGTVNIDSDPPVSVFIKDRSYGRTPVRVRLPDGRHRVRLTDGRTGINAYRQVSARSGRVTSASFAFGTCELEVDAPDGAVVKLNARALGTAPLEPQTIYEGRYLLRVSYLGAVWSERFDAPAGGRLTYTVRLKDAPR